MKYLFYIRTEQPPTPLRSADPLLVEAARFTVSRAPGPRDETILGHRPAVPLIELRSPMAHARAPPGVTCRSGFDGTAHLGLAEAGSVVGGVAKGSVRGTVFSARGDKPHGRADPLPREVWISPEEAARLNAYQVRSISASRGSAASPQFRPRVIRGAPQGTQGRCRSPSPSSCRNQRPDARGGHEAGRSTPLAGQLESICVSEIAGLLGPPGFVPGSQETPADPSLSVCYVPIGECPITQSYCGLCSSPRAGRG